MSVDAIILAGGRVGEEMAQRTGTPLRALFPWRGKSFAQWVYEALDACPDVERIAVVGPPDLLDEKFFRPEDLRIAESETISANLLSAMERMQACFGAKDPGRRVLVTACDNPLLTTAAFEDLISRAPEDADVAYPILTHAAFLAHFPGATNIAILLRDGAYIGGPCALLRYGALPRLQQTILAVLAARKSKRRMLGLLGWGFALRFALKRVSLPDVERRASEIAGVPVRFVPECDPAFPIDIDESEDWDYLCQWVNQHQPLDSDRPESV